MIPRILFCCVVALAASVAPAATTQEIQQTIDRAKAFLYEKQMPDRTWEYETRHGGGQKTGQTALAVYALLCAGESAQDERIAPALEYLRKTPATGVYALGLRCQIWLMLPPTNEVRAAMNRDANVLVRGLKRGAGHASGFYDYLMGGGGDNYSHSRSQYGVLGVWAAAQMGLAIPREYWFVVEKAWLEHQDPSSGGWNYIWRRDDYPVTPGMTAVGVATLFITQDYLRAADAANCAGNPRNEAIDRGMNYLSNNFHLVATNERYDRDMPYSTLYSIERVGVASGYKYFNGIDWYQKGADWLVTKQKKDGSFPEEFSSVKHYTTGLAILFLIRGSSPLLMNKLDYSAARAGPATAEQAERPRAANTGGREPHWNQRPRDVANLARWTGRQIERELNWQIVDLAAPVDDFHDAPILYISGNQNISFTDEQAAKIKQFVEQGGLVVGHADCGSANFVNGFKALGSRLFRYEFAAMPDNHVIFTNQQFSRSKWKNKPSVLSLGNGARELMILLPEGDPGRFWQMQQSTGPREEHFQLAADIFLYAVDKKNLRRRGESFLVKRDESVTPQRQIKLARLAHSGNWDPEPGGWRRLANVLWNENAAELIIEPVTPGGGGKLAGYKFAHVTGTMPFKLDDAQRAELKTFIQSGGLLIVDAAGGSTAFAAAAEQELAAIFPDAARQLTQVLPPTHAVYMQPDGKPMPIDYRTFARAKLGALRGPQLRGVTVDGRLGVIYSREDLSVGLVGQPVDGIIGYDPATATRLMANILDPGGKRPATAPATKSATTEKK